MLNLISVTTSANDNIDDAKLEKEYDHFIQIGRLQDAMPLGDFLNVELEERLN